MEKLYEEDMAHYSKPNYWRTNIVDKLNEIIDYINALEKENDED